jgi:hypothetical protein
MSVAKTEGWPPPPELAFAVPPNATNDETITIAAIRFMTALLFAPQPSSPKLSRLALAERFAMTGVSTDARPREKFLPVGELIREAQGVTEPSSSGHSGHAAGQVDSNRP